jgi:hypothetical protein
MVREYQERYRTRRTYENAIKDFMRFPAGGTSHRARGRGPAPPILRQNQPPHGGA